MEGNYVGLAVDRTLRGLGNFAGVQIRSDNNVVRSNLIAGNQDSGVLIFDGSASGNLVEGNIIALNSQYGVSVFAGTGNRITGNSIYGNRLLGIELSEYLGLDPTGLVPADNPLGDKVDTNDFGDFDSGANDRQNYPTLTSATFTGAFTLINVSFNSTAKADFVIEFYASRGYDSFGYGEGRYPLGRMTVPTDAGGNAIFPVAISFDLTGWVLTVTATNANGSTSEFSPCLTVP